MDKRYCIAGMFGALCFGIGDWMLGFVNSTPVEEAYSYIASGHMAYPAWKVAVIMALAAVGIAFLLLAFLHIGQIAVEETYGRRLNFEFALCGSAWLLIHFFFTAIVCGYGWLTQNADSVTAARFSQEFAAAFMPSQYIAYVMVAIPFIGIILGILRGKTKLPKSAVFFTPLVWMLLADVVSSVLPLSAFSKGLFTFSMNFGLMVWFAYLLLHERKRTI